MFFFLSRKANAPPETMLSKALPIPNKIAIPINVGVHVPQRYKMNAVP